MMNKTVKPEEKKKYVSKNISSANEFDDIPSRGTFSIDRGKALEIVRLAKLVADNGLYRVEKHDYAVTWSRGYRVDCQCLNVSKETFWYSAFLKHSTVEFKTEEQPISKLVKFFGIQFPAELAALNTAFERHLEKCDVPQE